MCPACLSVCVCMYGMIIGSEFYRIFFVFIFEHNIFDLFFIFSPISLSRPKKMASTALDSLETTLEGLVENFRQLGIIVSDFQPQGQTALNNKL